MIEVTKSPTADTRTCDPATVTRMMLEGSSKFHIEDVRRALSFCITKLHDAGMIHDSDKHTEIEWFHRDFQTGFKEHGWWDNHRRLTRHHLNYEDGVPDDVNLLDVVEHVVDCVVAGMARSGTVYPLALPDALLQRAFQNTVELLKAQIVVVEQEMPANCLPRDEEPQRAAAAIAILAGLISNPNAREVTVQAAVQCAILAGLISNPNAREVTVQAAVQCATGTLGSTSPWRLE